ERVLRAAPVVGEHWVVAGEDGERPAGCGRSAIAPWFGEATELVGQVADRASVGEGQGRALGDEALEGGERIAPFEPPVSLDAPIRADAELRPRRAAEPCHRLGSVRHLEPERAGLAREAR